MSAPTYNDSVFINCPFDDDYRNNFEAIVFTVYSCGFYPLSALSEDNSLDNRLNKIERLIKECRYGIHDISRIEPNKDGYPRFNMPFELGIFFGAKTFGMKNQKRKNAIVFEKIKYTYQQYISDLNGVDTKAHDNLPSNIIRQIKDWLQTSSRRSGIPGHRKIIKDFDLFQDSLFDLATKVDLDRDNLVFNDLTRLTEEFLKPIINT